VARTTARNVTCFLREGFAVATWTSPYDGVSAVTVDPDGMVRSALPIGDSPLPAADPIFGMAVEVGGRAMNLLFPYPGVCCAHGLVKREEGHYWQPDTSCPCGLEPIGPNRARERGEAR
jgi:hypothetical protein